MSTDPEWTQATGYSWRRIGAVIEVRIDSPEPSVPQLELPTIAGEGWPPPLACDFDCDDGCALADMPVYMRPYRCRHVTADIRRARDIVFGSNQEGETQTR